MQLECFCLRRNVKTWPYACRMVIWFYDKRLLHFQALVQENYLVVFGGCGGPNMVTRVHICWNHTALLCVIKLRAESERNPFQILCSPTSLGICLQQALAYRLVVMMIQFIYTVKFIKSLKITLLLFFGPLSWSMIFGCWTWDTTAGPGPSWQCYGHITVLHSCGVTQAVW